MSDRDDLLQDCESIPPITTQRVPHADVDGDGYPRPRWQAAADHAIEERKRLGLLVDQVIPVGMLPNARPYGETERQLEAAQDRAGAEGGRILSNIIAASYRTADTPAKKGGLDLSAIGRAIMRLFRRGK